MQLRCKLSRAVHSLSLAAAEVVLLAPVENCPASCLLSLSMTTTTLHLIYVHGFRGEPVALT